MKNFYWIYKMQCSNCSHEQNMEEEEINDECPKCGGMLDEINRWKNYED